MRRLGRAAVLLVIGLVVALIVARAAWFRSRQLAPEPKSTFAVDAQAAAAHLARALTFKTVSLPGQPPVGAELDGLHAFLASTYPRLHAALTREPVGAHGVLYRWNGREPALPPLVLLAHLDVVPVEPGTESKWTHAPFGGAIDGGYVWGRGAIDDKASALGLFEAVELLLTQGYTPRRTVLIALGADEEIGGSRGATAIAKRLAEGGVHPLMVMDEGMSVTQGVITIVDAPVAMVGIAEKGYLSVELVARSDGGHSSMPPPQTNVGILASAIDRLEHDQMPSSLEGPVHELLDRVGPEAGFGKRIVLANLWLFGGLVKAMLARAPSGNAIVRTTTAPTMFEGSVKDNVLPARARAVVNFRIRPGDTIEGVLAHVRSAVNDSRVEIGTLDETRSNPSLISSTTSPAWRLIERTIRQRFPDAIVAPGLVVGATDSRHYAILGAEAYRFAPFRITKDDLPRIHGRDERVGVQVFADGIAYYAQLLQNADSVQ